MVVGSPSETLLPLCRFRSTADDKLITLDAYVDAMKEGQEAIYYISGEDIDLLRASPQLEGYKARGLNVLLLTDPIDEFWLPTVGRHRDKPFKSVTRGGADLDKIPLADGGKGKDAAEPAEAPAIDQLVAAFKVALGEAVKDVRASARLTDSAVCLVAAEGDIDLRLERMLRQAHRGAEAAPTRVLEVNPRHPLIGRLADRVKDTGAAGADAIKDAALLLLDQARIQEGEPVADPAAFARRLSSVMEKGFAG